MMECGRTQKITHLLLPEQLSFSTVCWVAPVLGDSGNDRFITSADDTLVFMSLGRLVAFSLQNNKVKQLHKCVTANILRLSLADHVHCSKSVDKAAIIIQSKKPDCYES